ncbi:alanyl-tRNA editing protein [Fusobacterium sp.]|uniref:alanyl-tRNA editing protein n=1 Tax=Fusobacterium sp. TaxID=68766 RepID=UPI0026134607|nr:alanyl-tRNA editing protein [Fusobacterium sp.]
MRLKVTNCEKNNENYSVEVLYLDENPIKFYPDGKGGQLGDRGTINNIRVLSVLSDKIIVGNYIEVGEYDYEIDFKRREDIAVQHTAEHLFSGIAKKYFGFSNVGFRMAEDFTTVDLDSDTISSETLEDIVAKTNEVIGIGAKILEKNISIEEAKQLSLRKPISEKIKDGLVRIVEIENYDSCACAGFHVKDIKDIRLLKLIFSERIKGKYTRCYLLAGDRAIDDYNKKDKVIRDLNHKFSCRDNEILEMLEKYMTEHENLKKDYSSLSLKYSKYFLQEILESPIIINDKKIIICEEDKTIINEVRKSFGKRNETFMGITSDSIMLTSNDLDCSMVIKKIIEKYPEIKGGGNQKQGNIKGTLSKNQIIEILNSIL